MTEPHRQGGVSNRNWFPSSSGHWKSWVKELTVRRDVPSGPPPATSPWEGQGRVLREGKISRGTFFNKPQSCGTSPPRPHPAQRLSKPRSQSPSPGRSELRLWRSRIWAPASSLCWGCNSNVWSLQINSGIQDLCNRKFASRDTGYDLFFIVLLYFMYPKCMFSFTYM